MIGNLPLVGTVFEEIEILPAAVTGIFRDNDSDALGILPFFAAPTLYLVELSFDGGERQGLWMGDDPDRAPANAPKNGLKSFGCGLWIAATGGAFIETARTNVA